MPPALTTPLPPNPSLVAILLIVASRAGPRLVFHYPPNPSHDGSGSISSAHPNWYNSSHADDSDSDKDILSSSSSFIGSDSSNEDEADGSDIDAASSSTRSRTRTGTSGRHEGSNSLRSAVRSLRASVARESLDDSLDSLRSPESPGGAAEKGKRSESRERKQEKKAQRCEWDYVFGYSREGLAKLLSPSAEFRKRRFEVGIDGLCFLGKPCFERADGRWIKRKKNSKLVSSKISPVKETDETDVDEQMSPTAGLSHEDDCISMRSSGIETPASRVPVFEAGYGHGQMSGAVSDAGSDEKSTTSDDNEMSMFNVVFVLNPCALEYQHRVEEMYENVVKKLTKALKWEQAHSNYVWKESRKILDKKARAREKRDPIFTLWPSLIASSPLAKSIAILYDCISQSRIAHIYLSDTFDASFQIPQAISTPFVATQTEPQMPGLWLTTTSNFIDDEDSSDGVISPTCALLLLEDTEIMLKAIGVDAHKELLVHLAHFIRIVNPTLSLQQLAQHHSVSLKDVTILARHLIYWRKARAIPPLHHRDTYIVSPNADMSALPAATEAYARRFPSLPGLTTMLRRLSGAPTQYRHLYPTKDHRGAYMAILAWLMRGGWVTQLRTFGWVRVSAEVKAAVAAKVEAEHKIAQGADERSQEDGVIQNGSSRAASSSSHSRSHSNESGTAPDFQLTVAAALFPQASVSRSSSRASSDTGSTGSHRTAVHLSSQLSSQSTSPTAAHRPSPLHMAKSASSLNPSHSPSSISPSLFSGSIIRSPQKATAEESRWIEQIGAMFSEAAAEENEKARKEREELAEAWPAMLKYLDGRHALDEVAGREGWKRNKVLGVVGRLVDGGCVVTVRHW